MPPGGVQRALASAAQNVRARCQGLRSAAPSVRWRLDDGGHCFDDVRRSKRDGQSASFADTKYRGLASALGVNPAARAGR
jgi:hypothetical protein